MTVDILDQSGRIYLRHRMELFKWYEALLTEFFGYDGYWIFLLRPRA